MGAETELPWTASQGSTKNMGSATTNENDFPVGLRVLVVDDDRICLLILDRLLRQCLYQVTTCERAVDALKILRENKDGFDVVISDVHMPDMDGFKLLELVGLEMDLPVIMMSANGETSAVMKGIKHGACDYLLKPVRLEELRNIWQHVIRRKQKDHDNVEVRQRTDACDDNAGNEGLDGALRTTKKRKDAQEEDDEVEMENDDPATSKKPRVVWSVELHQKFVNAVNQLGIDKAVPKRILELMDVRNLSRENVASHLQKYRLYLKRISGGVTHQPAGLAAAYFAAADERFFSMNGGGGLVGDFRTHLSPQAFVSSLQAGLFDRVSPNRKDPYAVGHMGSIHGGSTMGRPPFASPLLNAAGVLTSVISSGLDFKPSAPGIGQSLPPLGKEQQPDKALCRVLTALPLSSVPAGMGRLVGHENSPFLSNNTNSCLILQALQRQTSPQLVSMNAQASSARDVGLKVTKDSGGISATFGICRPSPEAAVSLSSSNFEPSNVTGSIGRSRHMDARTSNDASLLESNSFPLSPQTPSSQSICLGSELGMVVSGKGSGLVGDDRNPGLHSILSDHVSGHSASRLGVGIGISNAPSWPGINSSQDMSGQPEVSLVTSNYDNQGHTSKIGFLQEPKLGWESHKFQTDLVEDVDLKPLVTTPIATEPSFSVRKDVNVAPLDLLLSSRIDSGGIATEQDDLLTCYIKQQQQEMMNLTEGDATGEGYSLGNIYK